MKRQAFTLRLILIAAFAIYVLVYGRGELLRGFAIRIVEPPEWSENVDLGEEANR